MLSSNFINNLINNLTTSNLLTLFRIFSVPFLIIAIIEQNWTCTFFLFTFSVLTDLFDGYLARYLKQETILGSYLDPFADKFLFLGCYITLFFSDFSLWKIPKWFLFFVLIKELLLIIGSVYIFLINNKPRIVPSYLGKLTTGLQAFLLWFLFLCKYCNFYLSFNLILPIFIYLIFICMFLTLINYLFNYFYGFLGI